MGFVDAERLSYPQIRSWTKYGADTSILYSYPLSIIWPRDVPVGFECANPLVLPDIFPGHGLSFIYEMLASRHNALDIAHDRYGIFAAG